MLYFVHFSKSFTPIGIHKLDIPIGGKDSTTRIYVGLFGQVLCKECMIQSHSHIVS